MKRRDFILGATAVAVPGSGQVTLTGDLSSSGIVNVIPAPMPLEERKRQYAICKERGHVAGYPFPGTIAIWAPPPPPPPTCKYCGTTFWTEQVQHEVNVPE